MLFKCDIATIKIVYDWQLTWAISLLYHTVYMINIFINVWLFSIGFSNDTSQKHINNHVIP